MQLPTASLAFDEWMGTVPGCTLPLAQRRNEAADSGHNRSPTLNGIEDA